MPCVGGWWHARMEYEHWGHRIYLFILTLDPSLVAVFIQGLNVPGTQY